VNSTLNTKELNRNLQNT